MPPSLEIEPFTVVPPTPSLQIFNVSLFVICPEVAMFNAPPWFVTFNLPLVLAIVPSTFTSPFWFVMIASPLLSIKPLTSSPSAPVFKTVNVSLFVILPVVPTLNPVPEFVSFMLPFWFATVPRIDNSPFVFVIFVSPVFSTVPFSESPLRPELVISSSSLLEILPLLVRVKPVPSFLTANLPPSFDSVPEISNSPALSSFARVRLPSLLFTVPVTFKSPALFVIVVLPVFSTVPFSARPSAPAFRIFVILLFEILPVFVNAMPEPVFTTSSCPSLFSTSPEISNTPLSFWTTALPPLLETVPEISIPPSPVFHTFNVSSLSTSPAMFKPLPRFVTFNLPL